MQIEEAEARINRAHDWIAKVVTEAARGFTPHVGTHDHSWITSTVGDVSVRLSDMMDDGRDMFTIDIGCPGFGWDDEACHDGWPHEADKGIAKILGDFRANSLRALRDVKAVISLDHPGVQPTPEESPTPPVFLNGHPSLVMAKRPALIQRVAGIISDAMHHEGPHFDADLIAREVINAVIAMGDE